VNRRVGVDSHEPTGGVRGTGATRVGPSVALVAMVIPGSGVGLGFEV
jgi:hypothetical protein